MIRMRPLRLLTTMLLFSASAAAQTATIDEGRFLLTRSGAAIGTESFRIVRQSSVDGPVYELSSTRNVGGKLIRSVLRTDSAGTPISYARTSNGDAAIQITASRQGPTRLVVEETGAHPSTKDYIIAPGTLILDDDLLHQLYLVVVNPEARSVAYISTVSRTAANGALAGMGPDRVELGNKAMVDATHFAFGSGAARREIWIDSSDRRLLKVSVPAQKLEALRDRRPPR
jgi:hypothetical protein